MASYRKPAISFDPGRHRHGGGDQDYDRDYRPSASGEAYRPGSIRDGWLGRTFGRRTAQRQVTAMATAGVASLAGLPPEQLGSAAAAYGVPLDPDLVLRIADISRPSATPF